MAKFAHELSAIPKLDCAHTQAPRCNGVCADVVNEKRAGGRGLRGADRSAENFARRLAGADGAGINSGVKMPREGEIVLHVRNVKQVCIRKQYQPVTPMKLSQERDRKHQIRLRNDDAVPCLGKLLKVSLHAKAPADVFVPFGGGDAPLLPIQPERVALNRGVKFATRRFATARRMGAIPAGGATRHLGDVTE